MHPQIALEPYSDTFYIFFQFLGWSLDFGIFFIDFFSYLEKSIKNKKRKNKKISHRKKIARYLALFTAGLHRRQPKIIKGSSIIASSHQYCHV